jgi:hypothetical protein
MKMKLSKRDISSCLVIWISSSLVIISMSGIVNCNSDYTSICIGITFLLGMLLGYWNASKETVSFDMYKNLQDLYYDVIYKDFKDFNEKEKNSSLSGIVETTT